MSHKVLRYINLFLFSLIKMPGVDFSALGMSNVFGNPIKCITILECADIEVNYMALDIWCVLSFLER
jgi:hypothetical protein